MKDFLKLENQLCFAIYETASSFNKLYTIALTSFDLTYPQYLVLLALWEEDGVTAKELGKKLKLGTGTLTPMIRRMEINGWVKKERSTIDERNVCIFLQQKALDEKQDIIDKVTEEIISCNIGMEEYESLMRQLGILKTKLINRK